MGHICTNVQEAEPFNVLEVVYYPESGATELADCLGKDYQRIIIDFGCMKEGNKAEFLRCHKKFVLVSLSEWQIDVFWRFYREEKKVKKESWTYLAAFGSEETRMEINRRLKLSLDRIPLSVDAFTVTGEVMRWFSRQFTEHF